MALKYEEWLKASGNPRTAASAKKWATTHGVALGLYDPSGNRVMTPPGATTEGPSQYSPPSYTPGALDATALTEIANLNRWKEMADAAAERDYQQNVAQIEASRKLADYQAQQGIQDVDRNAGARGIGRSGIRVEGQGKVHAQRGQQETEFGLAAQAAANARKTALDANAGEYNTGSTGIKSSFGERDYSQWMERNPIVDAGPGAASTNPVTTAVSGAPRVGTRTSPGTVPAAKRNVMTFQQFKTAHPGNKNLQSLKNSYLKYRGR